VVAPRELSQEELAAISALERDVRLGPDPDTFDWEEKEEERREHHAQPDKGGSAMTSWTQKDLERIGAADELQLAPYTVNY
jgi:hypothetical protein